MYSSGFLQFTFKFCVSNLFKFSKFCQPMIHEFTPMLFAGRSSVIAFCTFSSFVNSPFLRGLSFCLFLGWVKKTSGRNQTIGNSRKPTSQWTETLKRYTGSSRADSQNKMSANPVVTLKNLCLVLHDICFLVKKRMSGHRGGQCSRFFIHLIPHGWLQKRKQFFRTVCTKARHHE